MKKQSVNKPFYTIWVDPKIAHQFKSTFRKLLDDAIEESLKKEKKH